MVAEKSSYCTNKISGTQVYRLLTLTKLFNVYIDGLSNILNNSLICGSLGGKRINHMLYADDLCIVSLSSAGLQKLLSICDEYCASHSITFNVKKSVCMFFKCTVNNCIFKRKTKRLCARS